jgi:GMP synthase (glutamine-hydrolysing)
VQCFHRALKAENGRIQVYDLLSGPPPHHLGRRGRRGPHWWKWGHHSAVRGGPWLQGALDAMVKLYKEGKPTFASCWGFQALAMALGGDVVTDRDRTEVGTVWMELTPEGQKDPSSDPWAHASKVSSAMRISRPSCLREPR